MTLQYEGLRERITAAISNGMNYSQARVSEWALDVLRRHQPGDRTITTSCYVCGYAEPCPDVLAVARAFGVAYD